MSSLRQMWLRRLRRQRITGVGLAYVAGLAVVALAAFVSGNNLLFLILAAMVSSLMISGLVGRLGLAGLELELQLPPHTFARRPAQAKVVVKNLKPWLPSFSVRLLFDTEAGARPEGAREMEVYFPLIAGGTTVEQRVELLFPKRGSYRERNFEFSTRFPFGFAERREEVTIRQEVIVYPSLEPRPEFQALLEMASRAAGLEERGDGEDFYRIRPFEAFDNARHVDWKATAHTGALQVREYSQVRNQTVIIYLDLEVPLSAAAWFETAIECAAFLLFELAGRGIRVRFVTLDADVNISGPNDTYNILRYLALVFPREGKPQLVPDDDTIQLVFTQRPEWFRERGWGANAALGSRVLGPDAFDRAGMGAG